MRMVTVVCVAGLLVVSVLMFRGAAQTPPARQVTAARVLDNARATVQRLTVAGGYRDPESVVQSDMIAVQVTPGEMDVVIGGEQASKGRVEAGKTWFIPKGVQHHFSNIGSTSYDTLVITLK